MTLNLVRVLFQGGTFTTPPKPPPDPVSDDLLSEVMRLAQEVRDARTVWYCASAHCPTGQILKVTETSLYPEYYVFHTSCLDKFLSEVPSFMTARPLSEYRPRQVFAFTKETY